MRYLLSFLMILSFVQHSSAEDKKTDKKMEAAVPAVVPDKFTVEFTVVDKSGKEKGKVNIEVVKAWAPMGAERFYHLVKDGYFSEIAFFRVIKGFMAQFGIHGDPKVSANWENKTIKDDQVKQSNKRGYISFATAGPNTRTTQLFINYADNGRLDGMGFSPIGKVDENGMKVIDALYGDYGEGAPRGKGPSQGEMHAKGNKYLKEKFPELDYIKSAKIL